MVDWKRYRMWSAAGLYLFVMLCFGTSAASAQYYGPMGEWVSPPLEPNEPNGSRIGYGNCEFDMGLPGYYTARIGVHAYTPTSSALPDHVWLQVGADISDWERNRRAIEQWREPVVYVEYICGTGNNADIEFFYSDWLGIGLDEQPQVDCPSWKPYLMAARCQAITF
jgi:hypothetical protein